MLLGQQKEKVTTMTEHRYTSLYDEMRIDWLIVAMCHDFNMKREEVVDDLKDLQIIPIRERVGIISDIRMAYS